MAAIVTQTLIHDNVLAPLGAPTLPQELDIQTADYQQALIKYYSYLPLKISVNYTFTTDREVSQDIANLLTKITVSDPTSLFYVGVINFSVRLQTTSLRLNEYLLGTTYVFPNADPLKQALLNTQMGENIGDPYYEENFANNCVNWVVGGNCTLSVIYGLGSTDISITPLRHLELISDLVGCTYYKRLLAIRKTGQFSGADFTINTELLADTLKDAQTRASETLSSIGLVAVTIG